MTEPRTRTARGAITSPVAAAAAVAVAIAAGCGPAGAPPKARPERAPAPTIEPPLELVESWPIETSLDHPDLRDASEVWPEMIGRARVRIDAAQFYLSDAPGSRLGPVVAALEAAAARGVAVRFLAEGSFEATYPDTIARLRAAGAEVRSLDLGPVGGSVLHAKFFLLDGREAFLGSQNFDWRALEHIQELGARVRGVPDAVAGLGALFEYDWALAGGARPPGGAALPDAARPTPPPPGGWPPIRLVASPPHLLPPGVPWDLPQMIELVDRAERRVRVQLLTYRASDRAGAPWAELDEALRRAAARGVRVELLLSDWSKRESTIGGLQRLARTPGIEIRLATIPPWSGGFIPFARVVHAKLLAVDGRAAWLGTSNWEKDYFYRSRNVGLVIEEPALAARIDRYFETGWASPYAARLDPDATYEPPRIR